MLWEEDCPHCRVNRVEAQQTSGPGCRCHGRVLWWQGTPRSWAGKHNEKNEKPGVGLSGGHSSARTVKQLAMSWDIRTPMLLWRKCGFDSKNHHHIKRSYLSWMTESGKSTGVPPTPSLVCRPLLTGCRHSAWKREAISKQRQLGVLTRLGNLPVSAF